MSGQRGISLERAILQLIAGVLVAGLIPAALLLDRRLEAELAARTRAEIAVGPRVLASQSAALADAMMMHAKDIAGAPGLADAVRRGARPEAERRLAAARAPFREDALLVAGDGTPWVGPDPGAPLVDATRRGEMPVAVVLAGDTLCRVALAPVKLGGRWVGAAGVKTTLDQAAAGMLGGLTRSYVSFVLADGRIAATTLPGGLARVLARAFAARAPPAIDGDVVELRVGGRRHLAVAAPLGGGATTLFVRDLDEALAVLPRLRMLAGLSAAAALALALVLGAVVARRLASPVETLAAAADRVTAGDFAAPLGRSSVREVRRVARAFDQMRAALAARLRELETANRELATRQERLGALQAELVQRERMATAGRLLGYLAHEVRNPVANVRNCLELVRRRVVGDEEAREFVDMAIDELRRMHGLAEQMLDLNRPRDPREHDCDAATVARDVAALERVGVAGERVTIEVTGGAPLPAAIPPDALKQVLVNLVQNAREALGGDGRIELRLSREGARAVVEVLDDGPGLASDTVDRVFDPFFTTKGGVEGVGLGLYIADRIVRASGGRITARNRPEGPGACFRIELWAPDARPVAPARAAPTPTHTGAPAHGTR